MLKYLIINLSDDSTSFCYYNSSTNHRLINIHDLKKGFVYAMKRNLSVQLVYPSYSLPLEYESIINQFDNIKIKPITNKVGADVVILNQWEEIALLEGVEDNVAIRSILHKVFAHSEELKRIASMNVNLILTDIDRFSEKDIGAYKSILEDLIMHCIQNNVQIRQLTDKMILDEMNNCNAGIESITLAPNGKFYICPAFYFDDENNDIGDLKSDINIQNRQLYDINHAPLCRKCDAYQCKRCVWLNQKLTLEVNVPSWQQCVVSHIERNASRIMLMKIRKYNPNYLDNKEISEINYLDPFEIIAKK